MAEVFPLDINDQIDEEELSEDEFEEVGLFWMRGGEVNCVQRKYIP